MIRLTLLDGIGLTGADNQSIDAVLQQPKRLAVLAYLVLAGPGAFRSRDTVLALFWPELNQERARSALNTTLHFLKHSTGAAVVVRRGSNEIGIAPDVIWSDVAAFNRALSRGGAAEALSLYRGDLLDGFFIDAGPEFEQWLDGERTNLRRSASTAAWALAESAERDGQFGASIQWAHRSVDLSLNDEASVRMLLCLLERMGDRSGALTAYDRFATRLAQEYRPQPSAETKQIVSRLRSRAELQSISAPGKSGSDDVAEPVIQTVSLPNHAQQSDTQLTVPASNESVSVAQPNCGTISNSKRVRYRYWLMGIAVALCGLGIWGFSSYGAFSLHHPDDTHAQARITIDDLTSVGAPTGSTHLEQALTAAIVDQLAQVQSFDVISGHVPRQKQTSPANRSLRPHLLVTGSVLQSSGRVRVNVQITDAVSEKTVKTAVLDHTIDRDHASGDLLPLVDTLSLQISSLVRTAVGHEVQLRAWSAGTRSNKVYELMQESDEDRDRASQLERSGDSFAAVRALQSADSTLGEVELIAPHWSEPAVERAGVLERLAIAHFVPPLRDSIKVATLLRRGISEAARAVSLDRSNASALEALGSVSYWYWLVVPLPPDSTRRLLAQAERNLHSAVAADPGHASAWSLLSASLQARADFVGAYLAANRAYHEDSYMGNSQEILSALFATSYEIGDDSASEYWCGEVGRRFQRSLANSYCQLALLGRNGGEDNRTVARAWKIASEPGQLSMHSHQVAPQLQMLVAAVIARQGLRDSAQAVIQRAREQDPADPEQLLFEADARIILAQPDVATVLLTQYFSTRPLHRIGAVRSRRFISLEGLQRYLTALKIPQAIRN